MTVRLTDLDINRIAELPKYLSLKIPEEYRDRMGHMNVRYYMGAFDDAAWNFFSDHGMDEAYYNSSGNGGFALKMFIQYLAEVHIGDTIDIHTRVLGISPKRIHFMHFMINKTSNNLASVFESLGTHVDLSIRRTAPFPEELGHKFIASFEAHQKLDWDPPLSGAIQA